MIDRLVLPPEDMDALLRDIENIYDIRFEGGEVLDTAGSLEEAVLRKASPKRVQLGGAVMDVFIRLRGALLQVPGIRRNVSADDKSWEISTATPLTQLFRGQDMHRLWHVLRSGLGLQLPRLTLSYGQLFVIVVMLLMPVIVLSATYYTNYPAKVEYTAIALAFIPGVMAVSLAKKIARSLPPDCITMADLAAYMVVLNLKRLSQGGALRDDSFGNIRRIIAIHADCSPEEIERTTYIQG